MAPMKWTGYSWLFMSGCAFGNFLGLTSPGSSKQLAPVCLILAAVAFANFAVRLHYATETQIPE